MPRDSAGAYTLPAGNPVVSGTVIESDWANDTMADFAVQLNNVFTRDGLLGPIAPVLFVNGTVALPGIAFQESPSTGFYRTPPSTIGLAIGGVQRQTWNTTGTGIVGTASITSNLTVGGDLTVTGLSTFYGSVTFNSGAGYVGSVSVGGNLTVAGIAGFSPGTAANPGIYFTHDNNTGFWSGAAGMISFSTVGQNRMSLDSAGSLTIAPPTSPTSPALMAVASAGGFGVDLRGRTGDNLVVIRLLNNAYSLAHALFQSDGVNTYLGTSSSHALSMIVAGAGRLQMEVGGVNRFLGASTSVIAPNFYIGELDISAGTFGVPGSLGASIVTWGNASAGAGSMYLATGTGVAVVIPATASAVNYLSIVQSATGFPIQLSPNGPDLSIGINYITKGFGGHNFYTNLGAAELQFQIIRTAVATRWIGVSGSNGANPYFTTNAGNINIYPTFHGIGTTANTTLNATGALKYTSVSRELFQIVDGGPPDPGSDNRVQEWRAANGAQVFRVLNDGYSAAVNWLSVTGGYGSGISAINFAMSNPGAAGQQVLLLQRTTTSVFNVAVGAVSPVYQFNVNGPGQVSTTGTVFDLSAVSAVNGGTLYLGDTASAAGNGGCIMFGAFPTTVANGKHFASIKACITDASNNTAGELFFSTKTASTDTGSTAVMRLTADKTVYDNRNLPFVRDPGATAGAASSTNLPIGSIVLASTTTTLNNNALTILDASLNNLRVFGTGSGSTATITSGNWRQCGAVNGSQQNALWVRTS